MIIRDGRREVHDLGPRITLQPSLLTPIAGSSGGLDGTGGWSRKRVIAKPKKPPTGRLFVAAPDPAEAARLRQDRFEQAYSEVHDGQRRLHRRKVEE